MRRLFPLTLISLTLLVAACNWNPQKRQASVTPSEPDEAVTETVPEEVAEPESTNDGSVLGDILDTEGKTDEEVAQELLKAIFGGLAEQNKERQEEADKLRAHEDSIARNKEAEEKAAQQAAWEAGREAQRWWKKDFSITVERPEMMNSRWVIKRKGDRFYQSRSTSGITQYYVYYNKDGKVGSYSTTERRYNTHPDKSIDDMLEKWLKEVGVFMGYDYVHDYFDNTGETKTYAGRNVEVWENKKNTVYVDTETGAVLYQKNPKGESTTVKAFSTKVDVSDIASHLPKI